MGAFAAVIKRFDLLQGVRFCLVGFLNALIDLAVLNIQIIATGVTSGMFFPVFKTVAFAVASTNSFFWHRKWTFRDPESRQLKKFYFVTIFSGGVNILVASIVFSLYSLESSSLQFLASGSSVVGIVCGAFFNFFGYKYFVFKNDEH